MIANALTLGISKRELMEDYYLEELNDVVSEWNTLHSRDATNEEEVDAMAFFGGGGERIN